MIKIQKTKLAPAFVPGDKVKIIKKYRFLFNKDEVKFDGELTVKEFKPMVELPPYLVDIIYLEEFPDDPNQTQYFEKV